ncbi:hypothetical protein CSOJ01_03713 [Colletotrichum sojae]|uniref:Major facilitator superfamily transporter n=1 Tax=Colletotrichum sojae TaxID=2175907 RepID=A0A8H6JLT1_9PEZI|nr:hypothetical protein CSOJ01_03713 [Colletotrichum sojae]
MASCGVIPATPGESQHLGDESLVERHPQDPAEASPVPPELSSITEEIFFVLTCSMGQLLFAIHLGHSFVAQNLFADALQLGNGEAPWVTGAFLVANGVSVVISGSLDDLVDPKRLVLGGIRLARDLEPRWGICGGA